MEQNIILYIGGWPHYEDGKNNQSELVNLLRSSIENDQFWLFEIPNRKRGVRWRVKQIKKFMRIFQYNNIYLVGNSMGGSAVLKIAFGNNSRIKAVAAINSPFSNDSVKCKGSLAYRFFYRCIAFFLIPNITEKLPRQNTIYFYSKHDQIIDNRTELKKLDMQLYKNVKIVVLDCEHRLKLEDETKKKVATQIIKFFQKKNGNVNQNTV